MAVFSSDPAAQWRVLAQLTGDAVICIDPQGLIVAWNHGAEQQYGWSEADAAGRSIEIIVPPAQRAEDIELRRRAMAGETVRAIETFRRHRDNGDRPCSLTVAPFSCEPGDGAGVILLSRPLHAADGDRVSRRLAAIVASRTTRSSARISTASSHRGTAAAERLFGYTAEEMIGASIRRIIPQDRQHEEDETLARIRRGELVDHFETIRVRKNGTLVPISLTVSPILDADGTVIGASKIARDISAQAEIEIERARTLALAQEHAHVTERLNQVGRTVVSALDPKTVVQAVTDAATELTGAAVRRVLLQRRQRCGRRLHPLRLVGRAARRRSQVPDAAQHRDLRADVQGRPHRPQRRRDGRSAVRAEPAVPRHAGGTSAGAQLSRGAGQSAG